MADRKNTFKLDTVTFAEEPDVIYDVLSIFPVNIDNTGDKMYAALLRRDADDDDDVLLYRADVTDPDNVQITPIEDDDEFEIVSDAFDELLDEQEFDEMCDGFDDEEFMEMDDEEED